MNDQAVCPVCESTSLNDFLFRGQVPINQNPVMRSKQEHYVPGTGHPVGSYQDLTARGVTVAILMNPNYLKENLALPEAIRADVRLLETL